VVARFDDGSSETGDFLVGADGVHSRVRAWMHPDHAKALMPLFAPMIGKALTKVYAGDPALAAKAA
jgi:2-polyprenyl-6-methoxyphenol hydroxylase-like FAD-dependent oxidoreductase